MVELINVGFCMKYFSGSVAHIAVSAVAVLFFGYLLGSLNFGIIISKVFYHDDIRKYGSKNAGMTNMKRIYGTKAALFTLLGDALKTAVAVFIGALLLGNHTFGFDGTYIGGLGSILGHAFPVYYGFKGGKSVIATAVMILCTDWVIFILLFIIFASVVIGTRYISLGSIMAILIYPLLLYRLTGPGLHFLMATVVTVLVVFLHRSNLRRLRDGTESKFSLKKKGEKE
jgi:glycerol-3-phosphate acyltransferase PlsY